MPEEGAVRPEVTPAPTGFRSRPVVSRRVGWTGSSQAWRLSGTRVFLDLSYGGRSSAALQALRSKGPTSTAPGRPRRTRNGSAPGKSPSPDDRVLVAGAPGSRAWNSDCTALPNESVEGEAEGTRLPSSARGLTKDNSMRLVALILIFCANALSQQTASGSRPPAETAE